MADAGNPSKPPRGIKSGKEAGVLMSVIKSLSFSASSEHRDREKSKLEKEFRKCDQTLNASVVENQVALTSIMTTFHKSCREIDGAEARIGTAKGNLIKCKMLLHCQRDQLERLWLEGIEHKHGLGILEQVVMLRSSTDQFNKLLKRKQYLEAVQILMGSVTSWNDNLDKVEGLSEIKSDLESKREKVFATLKKELYEEMYNKLNSQNVFEKRQGSGVFNPFLRSESDRHSSGRNKGSKIKARKIFLDFGTTTTGDFEEFTITPEVDAFISTTVQCIVLLKEVQRFSNDLKLEMEEKLLGVVNSASQQVIEFGDMNRVNEASLFSELLKLLFSQFRRIVSMHTQIISAMNTAIGHSNNEIVLFYDEKYVWSRIQTVLQSTLKIYCDLSHSKSDHSSLEGAEDDINNFFGRRRITKGKRTPLFKFEYSLHGLNVSGYLTTGQKNQDNTDYAGGNLVNRKRFLVCKPDPSNMLHVLPLVQEFVSEIELGMDEKDSDLRMYITNEINQDSVQQVKVVVGHQETGK